MSRWPAMRNRSGFVWALVVALGSLASPPALRANSSGEAWSEARALADRGQYHRAILVVRDALEADPGSFELRWLEAGITGWAGRHAEAIALYEALVADHPDRAGELRLDLARERLFAGDAPTALRDCERLLAERPADEEVLRLCALALSWNGRLDEAERVYEQILRERPEDREARLGVARVANWKGEHRRAARLYEAMLAEGVDDPEVWDGLAHARWWSGRTDLAARPLDELLSREPGHHAGRALAQRLEWERRPTLTARFSSSEDSDDLRIEHARLDYRQPVGVRDVFHLGYRQAEADDPLRLFQLRSVGAGYERFWSETWSSHLFLEYQFDGPGEARHPLGDLYATWRPGDRWRFDLGVAREQLVIGRALESDITAWTASFGADWLAAPRWLLSGSHRRHFYDDGNFADRTSLLAQHRWLRGPRFRLATNLHFERLAARRDLDHGYYDPTGYFEVGPGIEASWESPRGWLASLEARSGWQKESGADAEVMGSVLARVEAPLARPVVLGVSGGASDSNLSGESGFERTEWSIFLRSRF